MSVEGQLMFYYWNLFPYEDCCRWFSYMNGYILPLREFAFGSGEKTFLRYLSFNSPHDFKLNTRRITPNRIDIGAVYNISPPLAVIGQTRKSTNFSVTQREVIFDIDISDYKEVRTCCSQSEICRKCWKYMAFACKILNTSLREDFGFEHILWTYSGNRGIHCWVCDEKARKLTVEERKSIAEFLQVVKPGAFNGKRVIINKTPTLSIKRALEIIEPNFIQMCIEEQNILGTEEGIENFCNTFLAVYDKETTASVKEIFQQFETSIERWKAFEEFLKTKNSWEDNYEIQEIMLQFLYPRLDVSVTTVLTHLLRCPFSPHIGTNRICVPFDPEKVDDFDPTTSPNFPGLFNELHNNENVDNNLSQINSEHNNSNNNGDKNLENLQKFRQSLFIFNEFLKNLEKYKFCS